MARTAMSRWVTAAAAAAVLVVGFGQQQVFAEDVTVSAVTASAFGYFANVSLFGGPMSARGPAGTTGCDATSTVACSPSVALPSTGGSQSASDPDGAVAQFGPALLYRSGAMDVSARGATGDAGSATTSSHVVGYQDPAQTPPGGGAGPGPFRWVDLTSTCAAGPAGVSAATTIQGGVVETKLDANGVAVTTQAIPVNPPVNDTVKGTIDNVGDKFKAVFNEQIPNADGSLTVNAAHIYLLGPTAVGDVIIGTSVCGVAVVPVVHVADLSVRDPGITVGPGAPGGAVTFTVTATNLGPDAASAVTLLVSVDGGKLGSALPSDPGAGCAELKGKAKGLSCSLGTLAAGSSEAVVITVAAPKKPGTVTVSVSVSSAASDTNPANDTATASTSSQPLP